MLPFLLLAAALPGSSSQPRLDHVLHDVLGDCRLPADGTIIVCGKRDHESPYRLPPGARDSGFDIDGPVDSVARERHKLMDVGATGTHSCSAAGAGGWTGCMVNDWQRADEQRGFRPAHRFTR
jgi:hypothetical protein